MLFLVKLFSRGLMFLNVLKEMLYQSTLVKTVQDAAKFKESRDHKISIYPYHNLLNFLIFHEVFYKSFSLVWS